MQRCAHLDQIKEVTPSANGCEECLRVGDTGCTSASASPAATSAAATPVRRVSNTHSAEPQLRFRALLTNGAWEVRFERVVTG